MYASNYVFYLIIFLSVQTLEKHRCIKLAHVNPGAYTRTLPVEQKSESPKEEVTEKPLEPNVETESMWFIGLEFDKSETINIDLTSDIQTFIDTGM